MRKIFYLIIIVVSLSGCIYNKVPIVVATQTQSQLSMRRDAEEGYWLGKLKNRRVEFETQLDEFVVGSHHDMEEHGLLTPASIARISIEEEMLRDEFDANEAKALADLGENLRWYDSLITMQQKLIDSELEIEASRADAIDRITSELATFTETLVSNANTRRKSLADSSVQVKLTTPTVGSVTIGD